MAVNMTALRQARKLLSDTTSNFVSLGRLLETERENGSLTEFCKAVPIHRRKAYDLALIARAVSDKKITEKQVTSLGWTKAKMIVSTNRSKVDCQSLVKRASVISATALQTLTLTGDTTKRTSVMFCLTDAELAELNAALIKSGGRLKGGRFENRSEALMVLVRESAATSRKTRPKLRLAA